MHCVMGADSCQSVFDTPEVTSSSVEGEDAVGGSQRRSVTWDCSCLDKDAEGFSLELKASTARHQAGSSAGAWCCVCQKNRKKEKKKQGKCFTKYIKVVFWYMENTTKPNHNVPAQCSYGNSYVMLHKVTWQNNQHSCPVSGFFFPFCPLAPR